MAASFVTSSLHLGHIATAMLPLCNNELTERCYHFGLTFVMKRPLISGHLQNTMGAWQSNLKLTHAPLGYVISYLLSVIRYFPLLLPPFWPQNR